MINLNYDNIVLNFQQLSGCTVEMINENLSVVESAKYDVESIIDEEKFSEKDYPRCEYAAAVCALYDFVCKESARDRIVCTNSGLAQSDEDFTEKIYGAKQLKISALDKLRGISKDKDFLFKSF